MSEQLRAVSFDRISFIVGDFWSGICDETGERVTLRVAGATWWATVLFVVARCLPMFARRRVAEWACKGIELE